MQNTAKVGQHKLIFGSFAVRKFCRLQGCTNDPGVILSEFAGDNRAEALHNMIHAGLESTAAEAKEPFLLTEFEVDAVVDALAAQDDKGDKVIWAFVGSVINKQADEVPIWMKEVEKEAKRLAEAETPAVEVKKEASSPAGSKSKAAPTVTA